MTQNGASVAALRDSGALLDPRGVRSDAAIIAAFHGVGGSLLRAVERDGRRDAAVAAVEVFRAALDAEPAEPSLHNGLGAALLALARFESHAAGLAALRGAVAEFGAALARRETAPAAARVRYAINRAMAQWMLGERGRDGALVAKAVAALRAIAGELPGSSPYWPHVHDILGNALMALGRADEAIAAYETALACRLPDADRARSLNNLGSVYAETGRYPAACRCYRASLRLVPRSGAPLARALAQHNLATALWQMARAGKQPEREARDLLASVAAFRAVLEVRRRERTPADWAVTAVNMAGALLSLGTQLCTGSDPSGLDRVREALDLYEAALPELSEPDRSHAVGNARIGLQVLAGLSPGASTQAEIAARQERLAAFAPPLEWPRETYARAHDERGEDIVQFLTRVWLPHIEAGAVDLRTLRARDPSAAKAIDNFRQRKDPVTGLRRRLPPPLDVPTKREVNDRLAAGVAPGERSARLDWALRARARRLKEKS